jgi:hypothetical protein
LSRGNEGEGRSWQGESTSAQETEEEKINMLFIPRKLVCLCLCTKV